MSAPSEQRPVGSATEEAARLVGALSGWFAAASGAVSPDGADPSTTDHAAPRHDDRRPRAAAADGTTADHVTQDRARADQAEHDPTACRSCPLCRGMQALRAVRPEVVDHLSAAADSLAAALRGLGAPTGQAPSSTAPAQTGPSPSEEPMPIRVHDDSPEGARTHDQTGT